MKIDIMYVNSDLLYAEKTLSSIEEAFPLLENLLKPEISAKLLDGQNKETHGPKMPCAFINCGYTDGSATLNIYPEDGSFIALWTIDAPRWNFLKMVKKTHSTEPKPATFQMVAEELKRSEAPSAAEFMNRLDAANRL